MTTDLYKVLFKQPQEKMGVIICVIKKKIYPVDPFYKKISFKFSQLRG